MRRLSMSYTIAEPCIGVKDASCVAVCPVDCIYEGDDQYYINPDERRVLRPVAALGHQAVHIRGASVRTLAPYLFRSTAKNANNTTNVMRRVPSIPNLCPLCGLVA